MTMQSVIETKTFLSDANAAGMSEDERLEIVNTIAKDPELGDLMPGTGGARKVRFAMPGKGKRGSYRTVHYYGGGDVPVFMLAVIKKGERSDLTQAEKNELRKVLSTIADDYRASVKKRAAAMRAKRK
jgi:hypothetical protein